MSSDPFEGMIQCGSCGAIFSKAINHEHGPIEDWPNTTQQDREIILLLRQLVATTPNPNQEETGE